MKTIQLILAMLFFAPVGFVSGQQASYSEKRALSALHPLYTPYVDVTLWPPFDISNVDATGICLYTLAFVVDNQNQEGANPCWGGYASLDTSWYQAEIAALRAQEGEVIVSFGGANGSPLAYVAADASELRDAYKVIIDAYQLQNVDFDIEGMFAAHPESVNRRSEAMKLLQDEYPDLQISLTLPVMPYGLTPDGINVITSAVEHDIDISVVNIMAMDYGGSGDMGSKAIAAMEHTFNQLKSLYEDAGMPKPDSLIWRMIGVTPMIGQNDVAGEIFYLDDAEEVRDFALDKKIGRIAMWSANRDKQCSSSSDPLYACSHIEQDDFEFSYIFQQNGTVNYCNPNATLNLQVDFSQINIYPNPAAGYFTISGVDNAIITIAQLSGKPVKKANLQNESNKVDISELPAGIYLLTINSGKVQAYRKLVVVK